MKMRMGLVIMGMLLLAQGAVAMPITYDFSQGGYRHGGLVSGFFTGEDLDGDGQLSSFAGEVTDFALTFTRKNGKPLFQLDFADLFGLVYDLDGGDLGDGSLGHREGILAFDWKHLFAVGPGPFGQACGAGGICSLASGPGFLKWSAEPLQVVARVPEPATVVLLLIGLLGLYVARRHNVD